MAITGDENSRLSASIKSYIKHFNQIKPYHTKILEVLEQYNFSDSLNVLMAEEFFNDYTLSNNELCGEVELGSEFDDGFTFKNTYTIIGFDDNSNTIFLSGDESSNFSEEDEIALIKSTKDLRPIVTSITNVNYNAGADRTELQVFLEIQSGDYNSYTEIGTEYCNLFSSISGGFGELFDDDTTVVEAPIVSHDNISEIVVEGNRTYDKRFQIQSIPTSTTIKINGDVSSYFGTVDGVHNFFRIIPRKTYDIKSCTSNEFVVEGNKVSDILRHKELEVLGTGPNDGRYSVVSATFNSTNSETIIRISNSQTIDTNYCDGIISIESPVKNLGFYAVENVTYDGLNTFITVKNTTPLRLTDNIENSHGSIIIRTGLTPRRMVSIEGENTELDKQYNSPNTFEDKLRSGETADENYDFDVAKTGDDWDVDPDTTLKTGLFDYIISNISYDEINDRTTINIRGQLPNTITGSNLVLRGHFGAIGFDGDADVNDPKQTHLYAALTEQLSIVHELVQATPTPTPTLTVTPTVTPTATPAAPAAMCTLDEVVFDGNNSAFIGGLPVEMFFKPDGTKVYILNRSGDDRIFQYSLSTPWDITTISYDSKFFNINTLTSNPRGLFFKPDGTKMYTHDTVGSVNDEIKQYSLSTAWDVSTASFDSIAYTAGSIGNGTNPRNEFFKDDGTTVFILHGSEGSTQITQHSLSIPWAISSASYDNVSIDTSAEVSIGVDIFFRSNGTKMYILDQTSTDALHQYTLSTAWDLSTASYDSIILDVSSEDYQPQSLFFGPDGYDLFYMGTKTDSIYRYILSTAWDISTASFTDGTLSIGSQDTQGTGMFLKPDGIKLYMVGKNSNTVYQYTMTTMWDIATASIESSNSIQSQTSEPQGIFFKPDGTKMYLIATALGTDTNIQPIFQYSLSTPWDINTLTYDNVYIDVASKVFRATGGIFFKDDGTKLFFDGQNPDSVFQYSLSTPWDLSTASDDSIDFSIQTEEDTPHGLFFTHSGDRMFVVGVTSDTVYQYSLSTSWDLSTASYNNCDYSVSSEDSEPTSIFVKNDETKMYILGQSSNNIYQYTLII